MLTLTTAILLAAAPAAPETSPVPPSEAHRAVLAAAADAREAVSGMYHWATHGVTLDRYLAQQQALEVGRKVEAVGTGFEQMVGGLSSDERSRVLGELSTGRDALAKANGLLGRLKAEAGSSAPAPAEVRYLNAELYGTMALVQGIQEAIGQKLGWPEPVAAKHRAR